MDVMRRASAGDRAAFDELFAAYRDRLRQMVRVRLNRKLHARVDPSDVVQDAYLQAAKRLDEYVSAPKLSPYLWLRHLTGTQLLAVHRHHLGTGMRDAGREISIDAARGPDADTSAMAIQILDQASTPSALANRAEEVSRLQAALAGMSEGDREIIALRYFEGLSNAEAAEVLGIDRSAASSRFFRALKRFGAVLAEHGIEAG